MLILIINLKNYVRLEKKKDLKLEYKVYKNSEKKCLARFKNFIFIKMYI